MRTSILAYEIRRLLSRGRRWQFALALFLVLCITVVVLLPPTEEEDSPPVSILTVDWNAAKDLREDMPPYTLGGEILDDTRHQTTVARKLIQDLVYRGHKFWRGQSAEQKDPKALIFELFIRRLYEPQELIEIHLMCRLNVKLDFENFGGGTLRDASSGEEFEWPRLLAPGEYHLHALKQ